MDKHSIASFAIVSITLILVSNEIRIAYHIFRFRKVLRNEVPERYRKLRASNGMLERTLYSATFQPLTDYALRGGYTELKNASVTQAGDALKNAIDRRTTFFGYAFFALVMYGLLAVVVVVISNL